jgi:hypothetical protein
MIDTPAGAYLQAGAVWRIHRAVDGIARAVFFLPYVHDIVTAHVLAQLVGHGYSAARNCCMPDYSCLS